MNPKLNGRKIIVNGETLDLCNSIYYDASSRLVIYAEDLNGELYGKLTVNIPEVSLEENEIIVKTWSENSEFAKAALKTGLFLDTGKRIPSGYAEAEIWRIL